MPSSIFLVIVVPCKLLYFRKKNTVSKQTHFLLIQSTRIGPRSVTLQTKPNNNIVLKPLQNCRLVYTCYIVEVLVRFALVLSNFQLVRLPCDKLKLRNWDLRCSAGSPLVIGDVKWCSVCYSVSWVSAEGAVMEAFLF